jgi:hypothetical protein
VARRLGYLSPAALVSDPGAVRTAVQQEPKLHRFVNVVPVWLVQAAQIVLSQYSGDAALTGRIIGENLANTIFAQRRDMHAVWRLFTYPDDGYPRISRSQRVKICRALG